MQLIMTQQQRNDDVWQVMQNRWSFPYQFVSRCELQEPRRRESKYFLRQHHWNKEVTAGGWEMGDMVERKLHEPPQPHSCPSLVDMHESKSSLSLSGNGDLTNQPTWLL